MQIIGLLSILLQMFQVSRCEINHGPADLRPSFRGSDPWINRLVQKLQEQKHTKGKNIQHGTKSNHFANSLLRKLHNIPVAWSAA